MDLSLEDFYIYTEEEFKLIEGEFAYIFNNQLPYPTMKLIEEFCGLPLNYEFSLSILKEKLAILKLDLDPLTLRKLYCFLFAYDLSVGEGYFPLNSLNRSMWNLSIVRKNPQACFSDSIPNTEGRFGLDPSNPIPVFGFLGARVYLEYLIFEPVEKAAFDRLGSLTVDGIHQAVDCYEIYSPVSAKSITIYVSNYHWKNSSLAPEGLMLLRGF